MIFNMGAPTIRWVGNESGYAEDPNWNVMYMEKYDNLEKEDIEGVGIKIDGVHGFGNVWMPAECDMPIRNHTWFYNTNNANKVYSLKHMLDMYEQSVGRGSNLLLNLAPNRDGLIDPPDEVRATELGNEVKKRYSNPIAKTSGKGNIIELKLDSEISFNSIMSQEDISKGQRIREYTIEYLKGNDWIELKHGWTIGHKKIDHCATSKTSALRIRVLNSLAEPIFMNFAIYNINQLIEKKWKWYKIPTIPKGNFF